MRTTHQSTDNPRAKLPPPWAGPQLARLGLLLAFATPCVLAGEIQPATDAAQAADAATTAPDRDAARALVAAWDGTTANLTTNKALALSDALVTLGQVGRATTVLDAASRQSPGEAPLWLARIDLALDQEQFVAATRLADEALQKTSSSSAGLHLRKARAYLGLGQVLGPTTRRAVERPQIGSFIDEQLVVETRAETPENVTALVCGPRSALYQSALAVRLEADAPAAVVLLAECWAAAGYPRVGLDLLERRGSLLQPEKNPEIATAFAELAWAARAVPDYLRYVAMIPQTADDGRPVLANAYARTAEHYARQGEEKLHMRFLERALRLDPDDTAVRLRLADAKWLAAQHKQAAKHYQVILSTTPQHPRRGELLARIQETFPATENAPPPER